MESNDEIELLIKKYEGIIWKIVNKYKVNPFDKDDLFQAGLIGLFKAIKNYKMEFNVLLSTYAFKYIIGEVNKEYKKMNLYGKVEYNKIRNYCMINNNLSQDEICENLKISKETLFEAICKIDKLVYLDDELKDNLVDNKENRLYILNFEEELLYQYYFVKRFNQIEIAKLLNISQSSVSRNIKKLKNKIKNGLNLN